MASDGFPYPVDRPGNFSYPEDGCGCGHCKPKTIHRSDCAVHNAPALPVGPCNCGAVEASFHSKSFTLEEVEALLAAERERCAKVAEDPAAWVRQWRGRPFNETIAAAIRSLAPQTIGDE